MSNTIAKAVQRLPIHIVNAPLSAITGAPTRLTNAILRSRLARVVADLADVSDETLLALRNVGSSSVAQLLSVLEALPQREGLIEPVLLAVPSKALRSEMSGETASDGIALGPRVSEASELEVKRYEVHRPLVVSTMREALQAATHAEGRDSYRRWQMCGRRLGLDPPARTLEEVAQEFGVTRERVRQVVDKTLAALAQRPVALAFRSYVDAILADRICVAVRELIDLSPWFGDIDEKGMHLLLDAFLPGRTRDSLVTRVPRGPIDHAIAISLARINAIRVADRAQAAVETIAREVAFEVGLPRLASTLEWHIRERLATRRFSFTDFVLDYVERSSNPIRVHDLQAAAFELGFDVSEGQARNTLAACDGVFPVGESTFGTFEQLFPEPMPELDKIVAAACALVEADPKRQFHGEELWARVNFDLPAQSRLVGNPYRLAALLRTRTSLSYLGRFIFSAGDHEERVELVPLARRILDEAGGPLLLNALIERIRMHRGVGRHSVQTVLAGLVEVRRGVWGLPGRDDRALGASAPLGPSSSVADIVQAMLAEDAFAALRPGESLDLAELRGRLIERGSDEAEATDVGLLRAALRDDERFRITGRNTVRLATIGADEGYAS